MWNGLVFDIRRYSIHDGPGIRTTIFLKGCPLRCKWCHNPEGISQKSEIKFRKQRCKFCETCIENCSSNAIVTLDQRKVINPIKCNLCGNCVSECPSEALEIVGRIMSTQEVINAILKDSIFYDESGGGVTFSGGEPLLQYEFLQDLLIQCANLGIHTAVDTSGYCPFEKMKSIQHLVNLFLFDIKMIDNQKHVQFTGKSNTVILENLKKLSLADCNIIVRIPIIPSVNDNRKSIEAIASFLGKLKNIERISLLSYHSLGVTKLSGLNQPDFVIQKFPDSNGKIPEIKCMLEKKGFFVSIGE